MSKAWAGIALLGSSATLVCCVIPALLVALGFGATLAGAISAFPQLTLLSEYKSVIFVLAGLLIAAAIWSRSRPEAQSCPSEPALALACMRSKRIMRIVLFTALAIYTISIVFVYVIPTIL
jgi:hypothetical protein